MSVKRILFLDLFIIITMNFCGFFRYQIITVGGQDNAIKKNLFIANVKQTFNLFAALAVTSYDEKKFPYSGGIDSLAGPCN